jgi:pimeloyl-ACP methyl ester carboxylesterase
LPQSPSGLGHRSVNNAVGISSGWFDQWANATWATDPIGSKQTPPVLRAPNGILQDLRDYWAAGIALYDPGNIRVPTLLIHAEWDADLPSDQARAYFAKLNYRPYSTLIFSGRVNCAGYTANVFYFVHGFYWQEI